MKIAIVARAFVLSAIPIVALIIITSVETMDTSTLAWLHVMLITYLLFVWLYTYIDFLRHELSVLIVTNERVIEIVQKSLFTYQLAEANLDRIQDVIGFTHGVFGMFFDLGRVEIQTAGTEAFVCRMVAAPHLTARKILNVQRQHLMHSQGTERRGHGSDVRKRSGEALSDEEILRMRGRRDNDELRETHQPTDV